jgi:glycosyltransferase involved in cell wall biosynthesis
MPGRTELPMKNTMPISICIPSLRGGGAEGTMVRLANELASRGYQVDLVVVQAEGPWSDKVSDKVRVVDLDRPRVLAALIPLRKYLRGRSGVFVSNMTHLNIISTASLMMLKNRPRLFVVEHNDLQIRMNRMSKLVRILEARLLGRIYGLADQVLAVSRDLAEDISSILGFNKEVIGVLPNGLDLEAIESLADEPVAFSELKAASRPVLVAIGRLVPQKGFAVLLDAMAKVIRRREAQLVVLGEGVLRKSLEKKAQELGISGYVLFPGFISNPYPVLKHADIFVLSSFYEGFGIVLLEAMACGTPVIASNCHWGPAELLKDGEAGMLVPPGDPELLADAVLRMLEDPEKAGEYANKASMAVQDYDIKNVADIFIEMVDRVLRITG